MAHGYLGANNGGMTIGIKTFFALMLGNVQETLVLNIGAIANTNTMDIATHNHTKPQGNVLT